MPGMVVGITLPQTSHLLIMLSCDALAHDSTVWVRALVDIDGAFPPHTVLTQISDYRKSCSFIFLRTSVGAGIHTVKIQWLAYLNVGGAYGRVEYRSLNVIALPA